jgi:hypothetical protein
MYEACNDELPHPMDELRWQSNPRVVVLPWWGSAIQVLKQEWCFHVVLHILKAVHLVLV